MFPHREPRFAADWWSIDRLVPILLILLLIGVVVWVVIRLTQQPRVVTAGATDLGPSQAPGRSSPSSVLDPALEQARLRYGRGELDRDTFLQIVDDLAPGDVEDGATDEPPPSATP